MIHMNAQQNQSLKPTIGVILLCMFVDAEWIKEQFRMKLKPRSR